MPTLPAQPTLRSGREQAETPRMAGGKAAVVASASSDHTSICNVRQTAACPGACAHETICDQYSTATYSCKPGRCTKGWPSADGSSASCTKPSGHAHLCRCGSPMQADGRLRNPTERAKRASEKLLPTRFEPQRLIGIERADTGMKPAASCHPYSGPSAAMPCSYRATSCCARSIT